MLNPYKFYFCFFTFFTLRQRRRDWPIGRGWSIVWTGIIPSYLLSLICVNFLRFPNLELTSLCTFRFQVLLVIDSNIFKFVNLIHNLFSAFSKWWLFIASKIRWFPKCRKIANYWMRPKLTSRPLYAPKFSTLWIVYLFLRRWEFSKIISQFLLKLLNYIF